MDCIIAEKMDWNYIYIKCPYCVKNYNKFKSIKHIDKSKHKRVYHIYNTNDYRNRTIKVKSNCIYNPNVFFNVKVDNSTLKIMK